MRGFRDDDRGFTPIAGAGLLVGVVVLLLAVVGAAMFGFIDAVAPPDAEFQIQHDGEMVITYVEGEPIPAEALHVYGTDPNEEVQFGGWPTDGLVRPGERIVVEAATGNEEMEVVWNPVGFDRSKTLGEYDPDEAEVEGWDVDGLDGGYPA
ncbi:type IV pilin [Halorubrum sp. DTA98]|uniref:type IV pilin n=1 Tax=Halorubrum sp. DTA98 TaxID=3402163 RepID=UPI003AAAFC67